MARLYRILLFLLLIITGCYAQPNNPVISDSYSWDFGRVKEGEVLRHAFVLKNDSQKVLNIKDVNTSCGCTVSKVAKRTLSPGEETSIEVTFQTKGYLGATQQFVYVHTDNLDKPLLRFIIKANVVK